MVSLSMHPMYYSDPTQHFTKTITLWTFSRSSSHTTNPKFEAGFQNSYSMYCVFIYFFKNTTAIALLQLESASPHLKKKHVEPASNSSWAPRYPLPKLSKSQMSKLNIKKTSSYESTYLRTVLRRGTKMVSCTVLRICILDTSEAVFKQYHTQLNI